MITFEPITEDSLYIAKEIYNSNQHYNLLESGKSEKTEAEIKEELLSENSTSLFIKADDTYIGIVDYLLLNPKDQTTWIGLFMIHNDYHGFGYGLMAYMALEESLKNVATPKIRLGVLEKNSIAKSFWERVGYVFYQQSNWKERTVDCFEKTLS